jgi:hypothetical protein
MVDKLRNLFPSVHIIMNTHYKLDNKLMKKFRYKNQVVFYTFIAKPYGRK